MRGHRPDSNRKDSRSHGFTLIELLVAIGILLALTAITVVSVNFSLSSDRIKGTARRLQSYLSGARDRAIYSKTPVGVRLLLDPNNSHLVNGMIYIGSPELFTDGVITLDPDFTRDSSGRTVALVDASGTTAWQALQNQELLAPGALIQIPRETGEWYQVASRTFSIERVSVMGEFNTCIMLNRPCRSLASNPVRVNYAMELLPGVLPGTEPVAFPQGVVIDLDGSQVPASWRPLLFSGSYSGQMDIMFSPRGAAMGDAAALGQLHFLVADLGDAERWSRIAGRSSASYTVIPFVPANNPATPDELVVENDQVLVTVATRTGRVTSHPVNLLNSVAPASLQADDPYAFAEIGEVANP